MSFFIIQVRSGSEVRTKELLNHALLQNNCNEVKAVYALDTCLDLEIYEQKDSVAMLLEESSIYNSLHIKRYKSLLNTLRQLKQGSNLDSELTQYKQEIRLLTEQLQQYRLQVKQNSIKGYILIETTFDCFTLSASLWQLIKQLPTVISIPSRYNVPINEVKEMFEALVIPNLSAIEMIMSDMEKGLVRYEQ